MTEPESSDVEVIDVVSAPRPEITKVTIERLLREKSDRVTIMVIDNKKKISECWKRFGFPIVDGVTYENLAACRECHMVYRYSSTKGNAQLNRHTCSNLQATKGQRTLSFFSKSTSDTSSTPKVKLSPQDHQSVQMISINAAALDLNPLSQYDKEGMQTMLRTAVKFGAKYGENFDLTKHIVDRTNLTRNYLPKRHDEVRTSILNSINGEAFCTTTDGYDSSY